MRLISYYKFKAVRLKPCVYGSEPVVFKIGIDVFLDHLFMGFILQFHIIIMRVAVHNMDTMTVTVNINKLLFSWFINYC